MLFRSLSSAHLVSGRAVLVWDMGNLRGEVDIERRVAGSAWVKLATVSVDGRGPLEYEDAAVAPGGRYRYRLALQTASGMLYTSETEILIPETPRLALEGVSPNPTPREFSIAFTLADRGPATIELLDLLGRVVISRSVAVLEPGRHIERLSAAPSIAPGVYFVRLRQGGGAFTSRVAIVN